MEYTTLPERSEQPCGCVLVRNIAGKMSLQYCPKHKAADDMYEALKHTLKYTNNTAVHKVINAALAKADGK